MDQLTFTTITADRTEEVGHPLFKTESELDQFQ